MSDTREHFNRAAEQWDIKPERLRLSEMVAEHLRDRVRLERDHTDMLEFGCGTGSLSILLHPYVRSILAVDAAEAMLGQLAQKVQDAGIHNIATRLLDIEHEVRLLPRAGFDLVVAQMVLHHLQEPRKVVAELKKLLRPQGVLCLVDLDEEDGSFHDADVFIPHKGFAREALAQELERADFFTVTFSTPFVINKPGRDGLRREYPLFMACAHNSPPDGQH